MCSLTMETILRLDNLRDTYARTVLLSRGAYDGQWPFILDADFDQLEELADEWEVSPAVLRLYIDLCDYIDRTAQMTLDPELSPTPEKIAAKLGIDFAVFDSYFSDQVLCIRQALADDNDEDVLVGGAGPLPWHAKQALLDDLQRDAAMFAPDQRKVKPR